MLISNSFLFLFLLLSLTFGALGLLCLGLLLLLLTFLVLLVIPGGTLVGSLGVDGLADLKGRVLQSFESFFDFLGVLADDSLVQS